MHKFNIVSFVTCLTWLLSHFPHINCSPELFKDLPDTGTCEKWLSYVLPPARSTHAASSPKPHGLFPVVQTCLKQTVSYCALHVRKGNCGKHPDLTLLKFSQVHVWKLYTLTARLGDYLCNINLNSLHTWIPKGWSLIFMSSFAYLKRYNLKSNANSGSNAENFIVYENQPLTSL